MQDYARSWNEYRRRRRNLFIAITVLLPAIGLLAFAGTKSSETSTAAFAFVVMVAVWIAITARSYSRFPCPRCGEFFAGSRDAWSRKGCFLRRKCTHCDLQRFASDDLQ